MPVRPPVHRPQGWKPPIVARPFDHRGSAASRGYDARWRRLRLVILERDPLCVLCLPHKLTPSHQVDHIRTIAERPDLRLDPSNLRGLCDSCHSRITNPRKAP